MIVSQKFARCRGVICELTQGMVFV